MSIQDFQVPSQATIRPVAPGEVRVQDRQGHFVLANRASGSAFLELPHDLGSVQWPLLTTVLDTGSIGLADSHFAMGHMHFMLNTYFDPFHGDVRDVKAAAAATAHIDRATFAKTAFIWSLNYKPYGKGVWRHQKRQILSAFLARETPTSDIFQTYLPLIAKSWRVVPDPPQAIWDRLSDLPSFKIKGPVPKMMRWFAWCENYVFHIGDYWVLKMLLEWNKGAAAAAPEEVPLPEVTSESATTHRVENPEVEMRRLRSELPTYDLCLRIMTPELFENAQVLSLGTRAVWKSHARRRRLVKSPKDALQHFSWLARGGWQAEAQETLRNCFFDQGLLSEIGIISAREGVDAAEDTLAEQQRLCRKLGDYAVGLAGCRAWRLLQYRVVPPFRYAPVMSATPAVAAEALREMRADWSVLTRQLEPAATVHAAAKELHEAIYWIQYPPLRLPFMLFERDGWRADSVAAQSFMRASLQVLPDSVCVEATHEKLRDNERRNKNLKSARLKRQVVCIGSGILEGRNIPHQATGVNELRRRPPKRGTRTRATFQPWTHRLGQEWLRLLQPGQKAWASPTPLRMREAMSAWAWALRFFKQDLVGSVPITAAWLSVLVPEKALVMHQSTGAIWLALGNGHWGVLVVSLRHCNGTQGAGALFDLPQEAQVTWLHVTDLETWVALPYEFVSPLWLQVHAADHTGSGRVLLRQTGPESTLLKAALASRVPLTVQQLMKLAELLSVDLRGCSTKTAKLEKLARATLSTEEPDEAEAYVATACALWVEDLDFVDDVTEAVYNELDEDNKQEYSDVKQAIARRRERAVRQKWKALREKAAAKKAARKKRKAAEQTGNQTKRPTAATDATAASASAAPAVPPDAAASPPAAAQSAAPVAVSTPPAAAQSAAPAAASVAQHAAATAASSSSAAPAAPAAPAVPPAAHPDPEAVIFQPPRRRHHLSFQWGPFCFITFRPLTQTTAPSWQATCSRHPPSIARGTGTKTWCTRTRSFDSESTVDCDLKLRLVKSWYLRWRAHPDRHCHRDLEPDAAPALSSAACRGTNDRPFLPDKKQTANKNSTVCSWYRPGRPPLTVTDGRPWTDGRPENANAKAELMTTADLDAALARDCA